MLNLLQGELGFAAQILHFTLNSFRGEFKAAFNATVKAALNPLSILLSEGLAPRIKAPAPRAHARSHQKPCSDAKVLYEVLRLVSGL